ncbi:hypothetical protein P152DRAFT_393424 [Eremomyces bilateralis CBS 781.70]|uniref:AHC1-like C2H2 zinc-finger domain-containing protein n=1 Tax=Eremomyces bilateralis CBS 781.70 TaxID=1392243 RepID=A0A6G1G9F3_9PEZI|nr:uncharacterized protein P152DRAFT_393424 [Eremomyces bilateralis CBS 781.70]KAF1814499.1 hypothetical protein P152DRAFT_393424 [Eremomyces bilateralis CBS 781.70]
MQSIFRLPWSTEPTVDRTAVDALAYQKPRQKPIVEIPFISKGKRKASELGSSPGATSWCDSPVLKKCKPSRPSPHAHVNRAAKMANLPLQQAVAGAESTDSGSSRSNALESTPSTPIDETKATQDGPADSEPYGINVDKMTKAQRVIEAQFDLEIMMKHEELRRIDQEMAKCQAALEQLRRCRIIPYPGLQGFSESVTDGKGPSLRPPPGHTRPSFPAPWGVADGPYSRHYAAWLLKDPSFDSHPVQYIPKPLSARDSETRRSTVDGRTTRGSGGEMAFSGFSRPSRQSTGSKSAFGPGDQTPTGPPRDPLVFRRQADGKLVRLACNKCLKDQFANVQGFINHYRIQHHYGFRSHEAAAIACGKEIDESEAVAAGAPTPSPLMATPKETAAKPITHLDKPLVHPLIKNVPNRPPMPTLMQEVLDGLRADPKKFAKQTRKVSESSSLSSFRPSHQTPHLNSLLKNRGFSGDLSKFVADATIRYEDSVSYEPSEDEAEAGQEVVSIPNKVKRVPPKLNASKGGVSYHGGKEQNSNRVRPRLASPGTYSDRAAGDDPDSPRQDEVDLSPNTVESNPGLVSDYEDDDDEDYNASSHGHTDEEETDMMDVDIEDHSDIDRGNGLNRIGRHRGTGSRKGDR